MVVVWLPLRLSADELALTVMVGIVSKFEMDVDVVVNVVAPPSEDDDGASVIVTTSVVVPWLTPLEAEELEDAPLDAGIEPVTGDPGVLPASEPREEEEDDEELGDGLAGVNVNGIGVYGAGPVPSGPEE